MPKIKIEKLTQDQLESMKVFSWPIWEKEASTFPWSYDEQETCYLLEGQVKVTPEGGEAVEFGAGDLVTFPRGMDCTWEISQNVRKHYKFG
jgi:uncharacterized cupin superfamily protein